MKKILLFSRDPGGANTIIPLYKSLTQKGYDVLLYGKDFAFKKYKEAGLEGKHICELQDLKNFLLELSPDLVITGTSADDYTEKYIWQSCEELNIHSFAILDNWMSYGIRFSKYSSAAEFDEYEKEKDHCYLPSKILLMDEIAKQEAIKEGLPESRLEVTGQPYFETIIQEFNSYTEQSKTKIKENLGLSKTDYIITFASEPISAICERGKPLGYTEKTIFQELLNQVIKLDKNITILIKQHPKENPDNYESILKKHEHSKIKLVVDQNTNPREVISISDLVCGMSSIFLIEAVIFKKPVISIQIGLNRENPFILDRIGVLKSIIDRTTLEKKLGNNNFLNYNYEIISNASNNILNLVEKYL